MQLKTTTLASLIILLSFLTSLSEAQIQDREPWSRESMKSQIDYLLDSEMSNNGIPGLAYVIVKADSIFLMGSAGFADLEAKQQVNPQTTQFLMGSNAKPITATAVMQLVEGGKLDLDTDVNQYLKSFQVPFKVTLRQLLTHTSGLEDQSFNRVRASAQEALSLRDYLKKNMPAQIFKPGTIGAYSNHGVALAGLIVEEVSGIRFEDYAAKNIFSILDMDESSFSLEDGTHLAKTYANNNSQWVSEPFQHVQTVPASMLISTVEDMGHFMIAHLNKGLYQNNSLLTEGAISLMHQQNFTHHPEMPGRALGFFEAANNGKKALIHGGTRQNHISYLLLVPEEQLGIYVAYNGGSGGFRNTFANHVMDLLYAAPTAQKPTFNTPTQSMTDYEGTYYTNRRNETSIERLIYQFNIGRSKAEVKAGSDGTLSAFGGTFYLQSEDQFNTATGSFPIAFIRDDNGKVKYLALPGRSDSFEKFPWYKNEQIHAAVLAIALLTFLVISFRGLFRFIRKKASTALGKLIQWQSFVYLLFLLSFIITVAMLQRALEFATPTIFYFTFTLPLVSLLMLGLVIKSALSSWKSINSKAKPWLVLYFVLMVVFNWELYYWNFLGYNF